MASVKKNFVVEKDKAAVERLVRVGAGVEKDNEVVIPLIEAAYFVERKVLRLNKTKNELLKLAAKNDRMAWEKFRVLKQLRDRGYIVKIGLDSRDFIRIYRKGIRVGEDRTEYLMKIVKDSWHPKVGEIKKDLEFAAGMRKELIYAVVSQKDILFIKAVRTIFD